MNIFALGDIHGKFGLLNKFIELYNPDVILQCGDFGYFDTDPRYKLNKIKTCNTKLYFCDGNHENHHSLQDLIQEHGRTDPIPVSENIYWMPRGSVLNLDGKNILFMGGANSIDKKYRTPGFDWFSEEEITQTDLDNCPEGVHIDIVISHTVPNSIFSRMNLSKERESSTFALELIHKTYRPELWYFGHFHQYYEMYSDTTKFIGLDKINGTDTRWKNITEDIEWQKTTL